MLPSLRRRIYSRVLVLLIIVLFVLFYFKNLNSNTNDSLTSSSKPSSNINENSLLIEKLIGNKIVIDKNSNDYEQLIQADLAKQEAGLGDNGQGAELQGEAKELGEKQLATIALNEELSEHLSYNRTSPDGRHPACRKKTYNLDDLLTTSVIVIFYNEPYSVLVRTVHSVLNTADPRLLKEIILVDDASTNIELKGKLDYYIKTRLPTKVKTLRLRNRYVCN